MRNQIIKVLILQYILGGIYLALAGLWGAVAMLSAFTGCMAALVPQTYVSLRMMRDLEDRSATQWLGYALRTELGKWLIMAAIFALAFSADYSWDPVVMFVGFILVVLSGWLTPFVVKGN